MISSDAVTKNVLAGFSLKSLCAISAMVFWGSGLWSPRALAVEVFVNGVEFSSLKDYRETKALAEAQEEALAMRPKSKAAPGLPAAKPVPFDFDPAKGKTVIISPDGSTREEKGVTALPDWMVYDPAKGKTIQLDPVPQPVQVLAQDEVKGPVPVESDESAMIIDRGRIAGVQPPLAEVVNQFQLTRGTLTAQRVSSSYELEESLRKAIEGTEGVVLLVAGSGKVRLYDLKGLPPVSNVPDGQKTR